MRGVFFIDKIALIRCNCSSIAKPVSNEAVGKIPCINEALQAVSAISQRHVIAHHVRDVLTLLRPKTATVFVNLRGFPFKIEIVIE